MWIFFMLVSVYKRNFPRRWAIQYTSLILCSKCIFIPVCNFYNTWTARKIYPKMCLCANKDICMNIHCSCLVKFYKIGGINFILKLVHLNHHFLNKKEFLCISDKIIAWIAMSKNWILVIGICQDEMFPSISLTLFVILWATNLV